MPQHVRQPAGISPTYRSHTQAHIVLSGRMKSNNKDTRGTQENSSLLLLICKAQTCSLFVDNILAEMFGFEQAGNLGSNKPKPRPGPSFYLAICKQFDFVFMPLLFANVSKSWAHCTEKKWLIWADKITLSVLFR